MNPLSDTALTPLSNRLLAALPAREYARLASLLEPVSLEARAVVYQPGEATSYLYFPTSCLLSLLIPVAERSKIEVALVGREGVIGLPGLLGPNGTPFQALVQMSGQALRAPLEGVRLHLRKHGQMPRLLLRYANGLLTQLGQMVACNARHSLYRRLACWLLLVHRRTQASHFPLTQEVLAATLGVRRASVSEAARDLQQSGWVHWGRGQLTVLDADGLATAACSCYPVLQTTVDSLYG